MAEEFEFKLTTSSEGDTSGGSDTGSTDSPLSSRERRAEERLELARQSARRAEEAHELRKQEAQAKLARQEDRNNKRRERFERKLNRTRMANERALTAAHNRNDVLRRRFINDFFGSLNQAHSGRRVNHALNLVQGLFQTFRSNPEEQQSRREARREQLNSTRQESLQFLRETLRNEKNSDTRKKIINEVKTATNETTRKQIRERIRDRQTSSFRSQFSRVSSRVGPVRAVRLFGARFGRSIGMFVKGLGKLGPIGLVAAAALVVTTAKILAVVATFAILNRVTNSLIKSIESVPSAVTFERLNSQFAILEARFNRARILGPNLARIERSRTENQVTGFSIVNKISKPFLPLVEALSKIAGIGLKVLDFFLAIDSKLGVLAVIETISKAVLLLVDLGEKISNLLQEVIKRLISKIPFGKQILEKLSKWLDDQNNKDQIEVGGIMKQLFQFMNNPIGDADTKFEVNFGPGNIDNVFEGFNGG